MSTDDYRSYIVVFSLDGNSGNRNGIVNAIKAYGTWGRLTDDAWVIYTNEKPISIRTKLLPFIGGAGRLMVLKSGYEAAWQNMPAKNDWLEKYL
jgi:hypothetical protein